MSLGSSLKKAREDRMFTQADVAKILYVTRQTVSRWEQNKTMPNIYVLKDLSNLYGLSIDNLISETKAQQQKNEEDKSMNRVTWFALFGVVAFNVVLFSGVAVTVVALLFALWVITGAFIISPLLLAGVYITGIQVITTFQTVSCVVLFIIGLGLYPIAKKATSVLMSFFVKYFWYNLKTIYR